MISLGKKSSIVWLACKTCYKPWPWPTQPLRHYLPAEFFPASGDLLLLRTLSLFFLPSIYWSTSDLSLLLLSLKVYLTFQQCLMVCVCWNQKFWNLLPVELSRINNSWQRTTVWFNELVFNTSKDCFREASWRTCIRLKKGAEIRCPDSKKDFWLGLPIP